MSLRCLETLQFLLFSFELCRSIRTRMGLSLHSTRVEGLAIFFWIMLKRSLLHMDSLSKQLAIFFWIMHVQHDVPEPGVGGHVLLFSFELCRVYTLLHGALQSNDLLAIFFWIMPSWRVAGEGSSEGGLAIFFWIMLCGVFCCFSFESCV